MSPAQATYDAALVDSSQSATRHVARGVRWWETLSIFVLTSVVLSLFIPRILTYLDPVTGDEPFYLMTAISMWEDHDLNECNNYRDFDEERLYPPGYALFKLPRGFKGWDKAPLPLMPHNAQISPWWRACVSTDPEDPLPDDGTGNEMYSKHGLGLSLLILPSFVIGDRAGVVFFLTLLGAALAANVYLFARESTGKMMPALLTWVAFAFTAPQMPYSYLIFPELPAALFVIYAFRRIRLWNNNTLQLALIGFSIAFLPWLHYRFVPVSAGLFAYFVYQEFKHRGAARWGKYVLVAAQSVVSAVLLMAFFYHRYETIYPNPDDHAGISDVAGTIRGVVGLFIDQQWGLFIAAPIFILALVGVLVMAVERGWRKDLLWIGIVFLPYFALIANYAQWWGEWCPPARYLASVLPLLALPFAVSLDNIKSVLYKGIYGALLALSILVMAGFLSQPKWMYNQPNGKSLVILNGLPELLRSLPGNLPARSITDEVLASLPTFVVPYFAYTRVGEELGDIWSALAWERSIVPVLFVGFVLVTSLAIAWWPKRDTSEIASYQDDHADEQPSHMVSLPVAVEEPEIAVLPSVELSQKESSRP
jgi:hypothetical protein